MNSNFSNTASLLWHAYHSLPSPSSAVNWAGFYFTSPTNSSQLLLGPFQGQVACQVINFGRGVCGTAAKEARTQLVEDVEKFPGHIACDGASRSEIVVPIVQDGKVCVDSLTSKCWYADTFVGRSNYRHRLCGTQWLRRGGPGSLRRVG
jgi:putative methionine-R-sulfoxide reductase with GAF domain